MNLHNLKLKRKYWDKVICNGQPKTYEIRKNDRDFQKGDAIIFSEVTDSDALETGVRSKPFIISSDVLTSTEFEGLTDGYCSFSIEPHNWFIVDREEQTP